jgi:hypothetical protein
MVAISGADAPMINVALDKGDFVSLLECEDFLENDENFSNGPYEVRQNMMGRQVRSNQSSSSVTLFAQCVSFFPTVP